MTVHPTNYNRSVLQYHLMLNLPASSVTEVANKIGIHRESASRALSALEKRGWVEKHHGRGLDVRVSLTPKGQHELELWEIEDPRLKAYAAGLERAARYHDAKADDAQQSLDADPDGEHAAWHRHKRAQHQQFAADLRAIPADYPN